MRPLRPMGDLITGRCTCTSVCRAGVHARRGGVTGAEGRRDGWMRKNHCPVGRGLDPAGHTLRRPPVFGFVMYDNYGCRGRMYAARPGLTVAARFRFARNANYGRSPEPFPRPGTFRVMVNTRGGRDRPPHNATVWGGRPIIPAPPGNTAGSRPRPTPEISGTMGQTGNGSFGNARPGGLHAAPTHGGPVRNTPGNGRPRV